MWWCERAIKLALLDCLIKRNDISVRIFVHSSQCDIMVIDKKGEQYEKDTLDNCYE